MDSSRVMTIEAFAGLVGVSRSHAYALASKDSLPVPVIRIGKRVVVSRAAVERLLSA